MIWFDQGKHIVSITFPIRRYWQASCYTSEWSAVGVVSLGFGVKVTVEVIATGDAVAKVGEALEVALPHGGQGLGADMALLALKVVKRCEYIESESSDSSFSRVGG